jgi:hypothetical protein
VADAIDPVNVAHAACPSDRVADHWNGFGEDEIATDGRHAVPPASMGRLRGNA